MTQTTNQAGEMRPRLPRLFFFLVLGIFVQLSKKNITKNQPIHDQFLLQRLVKWKYSRGTVDKKELKAILEINCWPRRYIFPHTLGLRTHTSALGIYTGRHVTRSFPASLTNEVKRNKRRVCTSVKKPLTWWWRLLLPSRAILNSNNLDQYYLNSSNLDRY